MRAGWLMGARKTSNSAGARAGIQRPTPNVQLKSARPFAALGVRGWMLNVGCSSSVHLSNPCLQPPQQFANWQPLLSAIVPKTHRHGILQFRLLAQRVEINRHTERRARFVLARVTAANRTRVVVKHIHPWTQPVANFNRLLHQLRLVLRSEEHT